jgi:hypothetical protein
MTTRVLFILKRREDYCQDPSYSEHGISTGLLNSATFVCDMLVDAGIEAKVVVVVDNNCIDREVTAYKPTHVIIEALWVVPEKFEVLSKLHPKVQWIVRFHSEAPFIAMEGIAMRWFFGYLKYPTVKFGVNAPRFMRELEDVMSAAGYSEDEIEDRIRYMPNYYPVDRCHAPRKHDHGEYVDVSCFGAIRPLKNHLVQAIAALKFAEEIGKKLRFHINIGRIEGKGDPILHNLQGLFAGLADEGHELVCHQWTPHDKFIEIIKDMDLGMQVSFSETFNIVAADMIMCGVPMVMSREVPWAKAGICDPTGSEDIAKAMLWAWRFKRWNVFMNELSLKAYVEKSKHIWVKMFGRHHFC